MGISQRLSGFHNFKNLTNDVLKEEPAYPWPTVNSLAN